MVGRMMSAHNTSINDGSMNARSSYEPLDATYSPPRSQPGPANALGDKRQGSDRPDVRESPGTLAAMPDGATCGRALLCTSTGWRMRTW